MATKRHNTEREKKHKPNRHAPPPPPSSFDKRIIHKTDESDKKVEKEQAQLWAKLERAERHIPRGNVAQRNRALERIYANLVANSAAGSFASSERGRKLIATRSGRDYYVWLEEQRRLEKAFFFAKMRSAGLWIFAPMHNVGVLVRLVRVLGVIVWLPMFVSARIVTLPLPILRRAHKR
jgi:hypothetical protein